MKANSEIKKIGKKFYLNKKTVAHLKTGEMNNLYGGWKETDCTHCSCYIICPISVSCP